MNCQPAIHFVRVVGWSDLIRVLETDTVECQVMMLYWREMRRGYQPRVKTNAVADRKVGSSCCKELVQSR
jgi:hypothetical protein